MKRNWHISMTLVCIILGILLATSFNTQRRLHEAINTDRKKDLIKTVHDLEGQRDKLKKDIANSRAEIARYEKIAAENQGILSTYTKELEIVKKAAGLTQEKGPGLIITLGDNQNYPKDDPNINNYVIHDYDIRLVVNSLWAGGAKAISVNGQRLISTSSIRCAGTTILINSTRLVSPYTIKAVGEPDKLINALNADNSTRQLLGEIAKLYGLTAVVKQSSDVVVPSYNGRLLVENAKVIKGGD